MENLGGKVAVITGAASGIGKGIAQALAERGMKLVLADVEAPVLHATAGELREGGAEVLEVLCDVRSAESVEALADRAYEAFGVVHVVCNNAGVGGGGGAIWEVPLPDWQWVLEVNLWGVVHGVRTFVPRMMAGGHEGYIVNTASMAGFLSGPNMGPYNASKHAVVAITETLHVDLLMAGSSLKTAALCPGWVNTNILRSGRNRPAEHGGATELTGDELGLASSVLEAGHAPRDVGEMVVEAIHGDELYIFTDDDFGEIVESMQAGVRHRQKAAHVRWRG
jgi:NAD(P)-dependent dehydrogenase (short-subunit alcohol dehydrogenase family)